MDILLVKDIVLALLVKSERSRDNDAVLMANVWSYHIKTKLNKNPKNMTAHEFLELLSKDDLPNYVSHVRARRELQKHHPKLEGKNKEQRKAEEEIVKQQLRSDKWKEEFKNK